MESAVVVGTVTDWVHCQRWVPGSETYLLAVSTWFSPALLRVSTLYTLAATSCSSSPTFFQLVSAVSGPPPYILCLWIGRGGGGAVHSLSAAFSLSPQLTKAPPPHVGTNRRQQNTHIDRTVRWAPHAGGGPP